MSSGSPPATRTTEQCGHEWPKVARDASADDEASFAGSETCR
jgi:hypothetical protein